VAAPLAAYLLIAVLLPALGGAATRAGFAEHCLTIAAVCGAITAGALALHALTARLARRRTS
jgi:hypothetical protein